MPCRPEAVHFLALTGRPRLLPWMNSSTGGGGRRGKKQRTGANKGWGRREEEEEEGMAGPIRGVARARQAEGLLATG